jgi:iron complex outermembrane receptor protein
VKRQEISKEMAGKKLKKCFLLVLFQAFQAGYAQPAQDTLTVLKLAEVQVQGFANKRPLSEVAAAISLLQPGDFQRFSPSSLVSAVNTLPGVRMEERSPGSYRFSIRGSLLRSPFGIRNVKVYWQGIPFTDPGGNTYLNLFDPTQLGNIEIIKGPAGSLYGAGTGGVILLEAKKAPAGNNLENQTFAGSYGLLHSATHLQTASSRSNLSVTLAHQESRGYRQQSSLKRDAFSLQGQVFASPVRTISIGLLYSDLYYQTPGGLTLTQYQSDPRQARPAGGSGRGAVEQQAAVSNQTFMLGIAQEYEWGKHWNNQTVVYGTFTRFVNPSIRNLERRNEQHWGSRSVNTHSFETSRLKGKVVWGGEFQTAFNHIQVYGNAFGIPDTLQTQDEIPLWQYSLFAQAEFDLPSNWLLTLGMSYNRSLTAFERLYPRLQSRNSRRFDPLLLPRVALLKKLGTISIFASLSSGYSPPTAAELRPSEGSFNTRLEAEKGISYELGTKASLFQAD